MNRFMKSGDMKLTHRTIGVLGLVALAALSLPAPAMASPTDTPPLCPLSPTVGVPVCLLQKVIDLYGYGIGTLGPIVNKAIDDAQCMVFGVC